MAKETITEITIKQEGKSTITVKITEEEDEKTIGMKLEFDPKLPKDEEGMHLVVATALLEMFTPKD